MKRQLLPFLLILLMSGVGLRSYAQNYQKNIYLATAGTLSDYISESEKYMITELTLSGELNIGDFTLIRDMCGYYGGKKTNGKLKVLDLSNVKIVGTDVFYYYDTVINKDGDEETIFKRGEDDNLPEFKKCYMLEILTLPNSIKSISSFENCSALTSINIPSSVISLKDDTFKDCNNLENVIVTVKDYSSFCNNEIIGGIKKPVTLIDNEGNEIKNYVIPDEVTSIGNNAFNSCRGLEVLTIGNKVTSIGDNAFDNTNIKKTIWKTNTPPSGYEKVNGTIVNYVPNNQFSKLSNIVVYPLLSSLFEVDGIKYVPVSTSELTCDAIDCVNNETVKNLLIPSKVSYKNKEFSVKKILPYLAQYNDYIETLTIDCNNEIPDYAFGYCSNLTSITLSMSIPTIAENAFTGCDMLTSLKVAVTDYSAFCTELGTVYNLKNNIQNTITLIDGDGNEIKQFDVPDNVTSIANFAFYNCNGLTSVKIGGSVKSIEGYVFGRCSGLSSVTIPQSVTFIGKYAFNGCTNLNSVYITDIAAWCKITFSDRDSNPLSCANHLFLNGTEINNLIIPNGVTEIGYRAFSSCSGLSSVTIPSSVRFIGEDAFEGCRDLTSVYITDIASWCKIKFVNSLSNPLYYAHHLFLNKEEIKDLIIPDNVTNIGNETFIGCSGLTSVTIPNSITTIGFEAFANCSGLTSISIPWAVTSIGDYVFSGCNSLKKLIIEDRENTLILGSDGSEPLFNSCPLEDVYLGGNVSFSSDSRNANLLFSNKTTIRNLQIAGSKKEISSSEFSGCTNLRSVRVGNNVTNIGNDSFKDCSELRYFEFGTNVKSIGDRSFSGCTNMKRLFCKTTTPPSCGSVALYDIKKWECTLYVPEGTVENYQKADQWNGFLFIEEGDPLIILGDTNGNNDLNKDDAENMANYIMGVIPDGFDEMAADVNVDGIINVEDIVALNNILGDTPVAVSLEVSSTSLSFESSEYSKQLTIICNTNWTANSDQSWCTVAPSGIGNGNLTINVLENSGLESRSATVTLKAGTVTKTVTVIQKEKMIIISPMSLSFQPLGGSKQLTITSDVSWTASSDQFWCVITPESGTGNGNQTISVAENNSTHSRSATVTLKAGSVTKTVSVTQMESICPDGNHPHWIDLGLSSRTMWSCCNLDASTPMDYGRYYTFYARQESNPSLSQWEELISNSTSQWVELNGVYGRQFTSKKNGRSVFFPATGYSWYGEIKNEGSDGYYWSSTYDDDESGYSRNLHFNSEKAYMDSRYNGPMSYLTVRPVSKVSVLLSLEVSSLSFDSSKDSEQLTVTCNDSWTASSDQLWCTVSPSSGSGDGNLTISVAENANTDNRSAIVTVKAGPVTKTVSVMQEKEIKNMDISSTSLSFSSLESREQLNVTCDGSWRASSDQSWCTVSPASGIGNANLNITVAENTSTDSRSAAVTLTAGKLTKTVTVTQKGKVNLAISSESLSFSFLEGSEQLTITCNDEWTVSSDQLWCTVSPTTGTDNSNLDISVSENNSTQSRSATLTVKAGPVTKTVSVIQLGGDLKLIISSESLSFSSIKSSDQLSVACNDEWTASSDQTWCTVSPTYGTGDGDLTIAIAENTSTDSRSANVTLTAGTLIKTVTVTQKGKPADVEAVDLGLPSGTLWANMNVGANAPNDYGDYFAWGETVPRSSNVSDWSSYKWCNGSEKKLTKYCYDSSYGNNGFTDNTPVLEVEDDAATANWGPDWCIPTEEQWEELIENTYSQEGTQNGWYGLWIKNRKNDNFIFLPSASSNGHNYWSSTLSVNNPSKAYSRTVRMGIGSSVNYRSLACSVRPVRRGTYIMVSESVYFVSTADNAKLSINCNDSWTVSLNQSWCTVSPVSGTGNGKLTITVTENASNNSRNATLTVKSGTLTKTILLTQKGMPEPPADIVAVDLGLPSGTLWANMNVGADKPEDYGEYFAWGEKTPKFEYRSSNYKWYNGNGNACLTKYCDMAECGYDGFSDYIMVLESEDDAATANWGADWCIPTEKQFKELKNNTTSEWTTQNGVEGRKFTSKTNGKSIFFPAAGYKQSRRFETLEGYYWASTLLGRPRTPYYASNFRINSSSGDDYSKDRLTGCSVRPVRKK